MTRLLRMTERLFYYVADELGVTGSLDDLEAY